MYKVILTITLILLFVGFSPYKFPRNVDSISDNELLVDHEESTCTADLYIVRGKLNIPQGIKSYFANEQTEFNIDNIAESMFDPIDDDTGNLWLIFDNQFIVSGKVIGVDSSDFKYCELNFPKFKIDKWSPTRYHPNIWTFSKSILMLYFLTLFACILTSIVLFFLRRPWKSKA
jgi:RNA binding exosome subunit